jgi:hypothetical protein
LLALQITLGALTVLSHKQFVINSLHVVNGALVLVTSLVLTLRAHRARLASRCRIRSRPMRRGPCRSARPEHEEQRRGRLVRGRPERCETGVPGR